MTSFRLGKLPILIFSASPFFKAVMPLIMKNAQSAPTATMDIKMTVQKAVCVSSSPKGRPTFMLNQLAISMGRIRIRLIVVSVFMTVERLLDTADS